MLKGRARLLALVALAPACFNPEGKGMNTGASTTDAASTGGPTTATSTTTTDATTTVPTTTGATTTTHVTGSDSADITSATSEPTTGEQTTATTELATSSSTTSSSTTTDRGVCGDGRVDMPDEECEDGNDLDTDDCTNACKFNHCGDNIIHYGVEECDGDDECDITCMRTFHRVFVTSTMVTGALGGYTGADDICQQFADDAGFQGEFKAWLGSGNYPAVNRFVHSNRAWRLAYTGEVVANNWTDLSDGNIGTPINVTESGDFLMLPQTCEACPVWTGTTVGGLPLANSCIEWETADMRSYGAVGTCTQVDSGWTENCGDLQCDQKARLYCFEQAVEP